jgi:polyhydroxybutyrate depolymerase
MRLYILSLLMLFGVSNLLASQPTRMEWEIDGVKREADVFVSSKPTTEPPPLVFGFHGHGGNMRNAARSFRMHELWPEAIVVYMQGLNTPGRLTDPEGKKPGWQSNVGELGDRDLKFFDAVLATMKEKHKIDDQRVYTTGHSNGGGFTYLLWAARGDVFAAVAPSAAAAARSAKDLKPMPVMHIAGENDELVKFAWQQAAMTRLRTINACGEGTPWHDLKHCTLYPSKNGNPVVTLIHPGTHKYPDEAPPLIVKFFKEHVRAKQREAVN